MARLADIYRRFSWRWDDAETLFRHALANDPADVDAHWAYSHELATMGRGLEGLEHALALWDLDHSHLWRRIDLPRMLLFSGLHDEAILAYDREIQRAPGNTYLLYELYYLNVAKKNATGLERLQADLAQLWQGQPQPETVRHILHRCDAARRALRGDPAALLTLLDAERTAFEAGGLNQATLGGRARDDIGFILAIEYALAGDRDRSIALLDQALQAMSVYWLPALPYGDAPFPQAISQDLRFQALWQRDPRLADLVERRRQAAPGGRWPAWRPMAQRSGQLSMPPFAAGSRRYWNVPDDRPGMFGTRHTRYFAKTQAKTVPPYNRTRPSLSALAITLTEESAIAAAAISGESNRPVSG
jgi:tetratricopeptide (TPR) repeat protein